MSHREQYRIKLAIVVFIVVTVAALWTVAGYVIAGKVSEPWQLFLVFTALLGGWVYLSASLGTAHAILLSRLRIAESQDRVDALLTASAPRHRPERRRGVSPHDLLQ